MRVRLRSIWGICGVTCAGNPARRVALALVALVVGGLGGEVLVLDVARASTTPARPAAPSRTVPAADPVGATPIADPSGAVPAADPMGATPIADPVNTIARLTFPAATTPDIAEVSNLGFEVSRIEFSLANLDGTLIVTDGQRFRLDADVLFRFDRADLSPKADALIADLAAQLRSAKAGSIRVDGYTDDTGDSGYNLRLSRRRASAVAAALRDRLGPGVEMRVAGHGEANPVADNDTEAGQARNRRVTVTIVR